MLIKKILFLLACACLIQGAIHVRNGRLVDDRGGQLIFHGLNVVAKEPPYHSSFDEKDMQLFERMGINGIRLGVMWPGVQPKRGQINETYLSHMRNTVEVSGRYGIYTLVEFHQDLFSQKYCADGVPVWAIPHKLSKGFPRPLNLKEFQFDQNGFPKSSDCGKHPWGEFYMANAVGKSFAALWKNHDGMRDLFINYWKQVAITFKNSSYVIAYEIMNEPWPGDHFKDPLVMVPGLSELINMQPAYDIIATEIRNIDPDHSICFEPVTWLNFLRAGFTHPPGGQKYQNTSIFCYHYYNPPSFNLKKFMKARMRDVKRLNVGGLLSEFYVIGDQGQKNVEMMDECDDNLQSWFGWLYQNGANGILPRHLQSQDNIKSILYDKDNVPLTKLINGVTRTYAPRVAGHTISQKYDTITKKFILRYNICKNCGYTLIFVSEQFIYKNGFTVDCYPLDQVICERYKNYYIKVTARADLPDGREILVSINAL